jgi:hypothetical protein
MEQYHSDCDNNNNLDRKKTAIESKTYRRLIPTIALPTVLLILTFIAAAPISPVQATGGEGEGNETAATPAPGGASLGPTANETNVTAAQSACLPQNATTTGRPAVDAGAATTTTDNTTATVAPSGASIGGNETSTSSLATAGNTTTGNTTATVAPSGASIC